VYLLDTNIVIYCLKGHEIVTKNLRTHLNDPITISVVTLMELYYGAYKSQEIESNLAKIKTLSRLFRWVKKLLRSLESTKQNLNVPVLH
jgi:predicted nucleic acid-binding protein